ncbi:hypothetical protein BCEN4_700032 [Burkholderia cenocepacia]|nr:hypothetical protein BCEN4_700032 [Burkholderia cenocepacia]
MNQNLNGQSDVEAAADSHIFVRPVGQFSIN